MRTSLLALGALALLAACQDHDAPGTASAPLKPTATPVPPTVVDDGVTVLSTGAEPRRELRYHLAKGTQSPITLELDFEMETGAAAAALAKLPTFVTDGGLVVDEVLPNGDMKVRIHIDHAGVRERPGATGGGDDSAAKLFEGFVETATLTPTGRLRDAKIAVPNQTPALAGQIKSVSASLEQVALPLPTPPVGIGASWKTTRTLDASGVALAVTTTTTLVKLEGERVTYSAKLSVTATDQRAVIGDVVLDVSHLAGAGGGEGSIDLATFALAASATTAFHMDLGMADHSSMQMGMSMAVAINPPAGP